MEPYRHATVEWFAPGDRDRVEHVIPGEEHRVPVHAHVDLRPGFDEHSVHVRLEMRSAEGLYLVEFATNGKPFAEKFAEIEESLKEATGVMA